MARILLIRLSSLGDVVLATSAVEAARALKPRVEIDVLTKPAFAEVFRNNPHVRKLHLWGEGDSVFAVAKRLEGEGYAHIADLHGNLRTRLLRMVLGGRWSVYSKGALARRFAVLTGRKGFISDAPHVTRRYADALSVLGVKIPGIPKIYTGDAEDAFARGNLAEQGWDGKAPPVALAPGARWATKAWPEEKWRTLLELIRLDGRFFPVLIGGAAERELCGRILSGGFGANLAGVTGIGQTAALLSLCSCLVTNDSAPLHLASAVDTPVVALFGPTVREFGFSPQGPKDRLLEVDEPCRPCALHGSDRCRRGHLRCMERIEPKDVMAELLWVSGGA